MAKSTPVILDENPNEYGTWNVKIRIGHKSKNAYLSTDEYVSKKHWLTALLSRALSSVTLLIF